MPLQTRQAQITRFASMNVVEFQKWARQVTMESNSKLKYWIISIAFKKAYLDHYMVVPCLSFTLEHLMNLKLACNYFFVFQPLESV